MVPLYLRHIPLNIYGAWLGTGNIIAWITILDPGLAAIVMQQTAVAYGKGDVAELNALLTGGIILSSLISFFLLIFGLLIQHHLIYWLNIGVVPDIGVLERAFMLAVIGSCLMIFSYSIACFNQGLQSSLGIGVIYVVNMLASLIITIILLKLGHGLLAIPIGLIVRGAGLTLGNIIYLVWRFSTERIQFNFTTTGIAKLAKLSSYNFFGQCANALSSNVDAFLLTRYLGPEIAPIFAFTRKIPEISRMILERPANAFMPAIAHLVGSQEIERAKTALLRLIRLVLWSIGLSSAGFFVFNRDFITLWVGHRFYAGGTINTLVIMALGMAVIIKILSSLCFSMGNIKGNSIVKMVEGILTVLFMFIGTKYWGMTGLAVAPLLAMTLVSSWYYPRVFAKLLSLNKSDILTITYEVYVSLVASVVTAALFFRASSNTWLYFTTRVCAFSLVYSVVILLLSRSFRREFFNFFTKASST